jgi:hypothetical protein
LECGPKLPPQQRPRSITSVPADYRRPVSLNIDTRLLESLQDETDTPKSADSTSSALHSLPVSPFMFPTYSYLDSYDAPTTPIGGSPVPFNLDPMEPPPMGYRLFLQQVNVE